MTEKIENQIMEISSMIDGINIGLERARELREKLLLSGQQETLGLDALIDLLNKDKFEMAEAMNELRKMLSIDERLKRESLQESEALGDV